MDSAPASFDFAKEVVTQVIGLCTAVVAVSATFAKDFQVSDKVVDYRWLFTAWVLLLISLVFGVLTLMSMAGTLAGQKVQPDAIYAFSIASKAVVEILAFLAGVILIVIHAMKRVRPR
jgi:hypothetical protein